MSEEETVSRDDVALAERKTGALRRSNMNIRNTALKRSISFSDTMLSSATKEEDAAVRFIRAHTHVPNVTDFELLNFVRDKSESIENAQKYAKESEKWKRRYKPKDIRINDVATLLRQYNCWISSTSRNGFPVIFVENFGAYKDSGNIEEIVRMLSYCIELILQRNERFNICIDMKNVSVTNVDDRMIRMLMQVIEFNYPRSIETIVVPNIPLWCKGLFQVVKGWVDPKWRNALGLHSNYDCLTQQYGASIIPARLKGKASNDLGVEKFIMERMRDEEIESVIPTHECHIATQLWLGCWDTTPQEIPNTIISGKLKKVGGIVKLWKAFFFVLQDNQEIGGVLYYFKSLKEPTPVGVVLLEDAELIESVDKKSCFDIQCPLRLWHFQAENEREQITWTSALKPYCVPLRHSTDSEEEKDEIRSKTQIGENKFVDEKETKEKKSRKERRGKKEKMSKE